MIISRYYDDYRLLGQYSQLATGWDIFVRINNNHAYNIIAHPHGSVVLQGIGNKNVTSTGLKPKELGNKSCYIQDNEYISQSLATFDINIIWYS